MNILQPMGEWILLYSKWINLHFWSPPETHLGDGIFLACSVLSTFGNVAPPV